MNDTCLCPCVRVSSVVSHLCVRACVRACMRVCVCVCVCATPTYFKSSSATPRGCFFTQSIFFDEAAIVLQQYEIVSGSKYTLRTYHSFFPCQ